MAQAIAIMAKTPRAGDVKTRLCPPLTPAEAAALYRCFLLDTIAKVTTLEARCRPVISYTPVTDRTYFAALAPRCMLLPQRGADLGARMADCFAQLFALGYADVLLTGSDLPTLPRTVLQHALALIATPQIDMVLGPSEDGGYYLIGLRVLYRELFEHMTWSTPQVFAETMQRAERLGLRVAHLPTWYDVDIPADLARLRQTLQQEDPDRPRHTQQFLSDQLSAISC